MRFVNAFLCNLFARRMVVVGLTACMLACATEPTANTTPAPQPAALGAALGAAAAVAPPPLPPIPPEVQRAFDAACADFAAGRLAQAERAFSALATSHPLLGGPQANLGLIYRQSGRLDAAVAALEKAVALSPRTAAYQDELGIAYRLRGQFRKAQQAYEAALAIDPNYAPAYLNLGILFDLYFADSQRAVSLYDRYLALTPAGDEQVKKWLADIRNRGPRKAPTNAPPKPKESSP